MFWRGSRSDLRRLDDVRTQVSKSMSITRRHFTESVVATNRISMGALRYSLAGGMEGRSPLRKLFRYTRLYGPSRTLSKLNGWRHANASRCLLPRLRWPSVDVPRHVGLIGCGRFAFSTLAFFLEKHRGGVIRGVMDLDETRAQSLARHYGALYHTRDADAILDDPHIDLVFVAASHRSHAAYAIKALEAGKHVHLEKPHAVSLAELTNLCRAMSRSPGRLMLGFNRRNSPAMHLVKRRLDDEAGPATINWFVTGHKLPADHWYFATGEGGQLLGNLCHWTDALLHFVDEAHRYPIHVQALHPEPLHDRCIVGYRFGDGSVATITFTARAATFEGVRERLSGQKGNLLFFIDDFQRAKLCIDAKSISWRSRRRDPGHEATVCQSYFLTGRTGPPATGWSTGEVWQTGRLMLATKEVVRAGHSTTLPRLDQPVFT